MQVFNLRSPRVKKDRRERRQRAGWRSGALASAASGLVSPEEAEVFLKDRMPAYISWERYQRNRAQIAKNRADCVGPVRAGQALLSGLLVCGHCSLRMMAQYNSNGSGLRYVCCRMMVCSATTTTAWSVN
jgi:hypothetical protein